MPNYSGESSGLNFPKLDVAPQVSEPPTPLASSGNAGALAEIGDAADSFGRSLTALATRAAQSSARRQATADATAAGSMGSLVQQNDMTVWGQTYNEIAKQQLGVQRQAALRTSMAQAYVDHQDDPAALDKSLKDIQSGFGASGFADLDASLASDWQVQHGNYMTQAASALRDRAIAQGKANFADTLTQGVDLLTQTARGASFDAAGGARVTASYTNLLQQLSRYGPKEAFDVAGVHFDADPTRAAALDAADIEHVAIGANQAAKTSWILGQNDRLTTAAAKQAFVTDLTARYANHDPLLAGIDGQQFEEALSHLGADVDKATVQERQGLELHAQNARNQIEALKWGGSYDRNTMLAEARASGDAGLMAEADFYANASDSVRGVLRTVVARSLGLLPEPGAGGGGIPPEALDANGAPVAGAPSPGGGGLMPLHLPVQGRITSGFGPRTAPMAGASTYHEGVDIAVPAGTPVGAAGPGVVVNAGPQGGLGNAVTVRHADGSTTVVGHLSQVTVHAGDQVADGQQLGLSGSTGISTGPHVHFGRRDAQGRPVNPLTGVASGPAASPWASPPAGAAPGTPAYVAWVNTRDGFNSDPLKFAQGHGLAQVPAIIPQAGFSQDPAQLANFTGAMKQRLALGAALQRTYGVPLRMFTTPEIDDFKSLLQQDPGAGVTLAGTFTGALGPAGASEALRELGVNGPDVTTQLHLGQLAIGGQRANIVNAAVDGMRLHAEGAEFPKWSTPGGAPVRGFDQAMQDYGGAFQAQPDVGQAVRNVAELARLADVKRGIVASPDYYLQAAAGSVMQGGVAYGGLAQVNGAWTLLPTWLRRDDESAVLGYIGKGLSTRFLLHGDAPVYANGQPMSAADFSQYQMLGRPDGSYWLRNPRTGQLARRSDGSVYRLNLDGLREDLAQHVPGSVLR